MKQFTRRLKGKGNKSQNILEMELEKDVWQEVQGAGAQEKESQVSADSLTIRIDCPIT
jgi:hypothetical protein